MGIGAWGEMALPISPHDPIPISPHPPKNILYPILQPAVIIPLMYTCTDMCPTKKPTSFFVRSISFSSTGKFIKVKFSKNRFFFKMSSPQVNQ